ncbi:MAG: hypothetical protein WCC06_09750 [Candidatus Aminicenantales bacterium]
MKKCLSIGLLGLVILMLSFSSTEARTRYYSPADNYLNVSLFLLHPLSVGYKHQVRTNFFLTGNMDYSSQEKDLLFQAGAAYMIPKKFLIFRFYGGGGVEFSRNNGYSYPYVSIGTNFWVLYSEIVHPLRSSSEPGFRFGFSLAF